MIFIHADLIDEDFALFLVLVASTLFALLVGIAFHEACHAFAADSLGDDLPRRMGRTTLNPVAHLDPAGTVLMLIIGFGWGKPVQFNPYGLRTNPRTAALLVALAGPLSNFVAAGLIAIPIQVGAVPYINPFTEFSDFLAFRVSDTKDYIGLFLTGAVYLNCILGVFNLIPVHPLDGFKVAVGLLPEKLANEFAKLAPQGPGILLMLLFGIPILTSWLLGETYFPLSDIMQPSVRWLVHLFTGV